jgi:hypothetical protein
MLRYTYSAYLVNLITTNVLMEEINYCNSGRKKKDTWLSMLCTGMFSPSPFKRDQNESTSLSSGPWFPKQQRYLKCSQALLICLSGKRNMNMSILHWWNDTDTGKPNYSQRNLFQWLLSTIYLTWTDLWSKPGLRGDRPSTNCLCIARPI